MSAHSRPAERVGAGTAGPDAASARGFGARLRRLDPEFGVSVFLLGVGIVVLIGTTAIPTDAGQRGAVGPKAFPTVIGAGLVVVAIVHAWDVARGGHGEAEAGEDIELGAPADWKTLAVVLAAFLSNVFLIETLGWPLSGALMFLIAARGLGSRTLVRDVGVALALSFGTYFLFVNGLGLTLPAGVLDGVIN